MEQQLERSSLDALEEAVRAAGISARTKQRTIGRSYKGDGTVVTETDLEISEAIIAHIEAHFPGMNIISEENLTPFDVEAPWTFVLDPIDGTDVYSQGFPSWAVALAILDRERNPVGAMISAPRWGLGEEELFVRLDPGGDLLVNGELFTPHGEKDVPDQITLGSLVQRHFDFSAFTGKIRALGSTILHLLAPVIYDYVQGSICQSCHAWDIAASHAVLRHAGMDIEYIDGAPFIYTDALLIERKPYSPSIIAGTPACITALRKMLPPLQSDR
jgi:fructose-1,6-bisphosphatase/inositol monophosphatase family enzyme